MLISVAIPGGVLALILTHGSSDTAAVAAPSTTLVAPTDARKARIGAPAPDFTLRSTTGKSMTLSALRGRPVVIAFFASWCHPCEEELPVLQGFAAQHTGRLSVIGVNYQDLPSDSAAFVRRLHITFPALVEDADDPIAQRYGVRGIPQTVFIDAHGVVRGRVYGQTSHRALAPAITALLAGRPVPVI